MKSLVSVRLRPRYYGSGFDFTKPEEALEGVRRQCWEALVERLELRKVMTHERWQELQRQLEREELPEISVESVNAFVAGYMKDLPTLFEESLHEVFDMLRPRRSELKTNRGPEVGVKVILHYTVEEGYGRNRFAVRYHSEQRLTALENVLNALAGNGFINNSYHSALKTAIEASEDGRGETDLFRFKACKNGNLHIQCKRPALIAELNRRAGGKTLKAVA